MTQETITKQQIKAYLNLKGYFWWYNLAGIGAQKGIPDMFVLHKGILFAVEVKTSTGNLSTWQTQFLENVNDHGGMPVVARSVEDIIKFLP